MGWNNDKTTQPIVVDNETYKLYKQLAKKAVSKLCCAIRFPMA
jgi:hypothetical protein